MASIAALTRRGLALARVAPFGGEHALRSIVTALLAANLLAVSVAFLIEGPSSVAAHADTVLNWCRIR